MIGYLLAISFVLINNTINITSYILESVRQNHNIAYWKPVAWESTSAISTAILLPLMFHLFRKYPPYLRRIRLFVLIHLGCSAVFSLLHVFIMVQLRHVIYFFHSHTYQFGDLFRELLYEYRKDVWAYIIFITGYYLICFCYGRIKGEAKKIDTQHGEQFEKNETPTHFIIKKFDTEFLINSSDIEWIESSGNYVNFHVKQRVYPYRSSLSSATDLLANVGICRIHRSYSVNYHQIAAIKYDKNGDGIITLISGQILRLSRTFNAPLKSKLNQREIKH